MTVQYILKKWRLFALQNDPNMFFHDIYFLQFQIHPEGYVSIGRKAKGLADAADLSCFNFLAAFLTKQDPKCASKMSFQVSV